MCNTVALSLIATQYHQLELTLVNLKITLIDFRLIAWYSSLVSDVIQLTEQTHISDSLGMASALVELNPGL